jgi:hypothetical protein
MRARFQGMTLQTLLRQHGITKIKELMHGTGLSRQQSWNLWHGYVGVGRPTSKLLHERLGLPAEALLQVDPVPARNRPHTTPPKPRGRPRTRPSSATPRPEEDA